MIYIKTKSGFDIVAMNYEENPLSIDTTDAYYICRGENRVFLKEVTEFCEKKTVKFFRNEILVSGKPVIQVQKFVENALSSSENEVDIDDCLEYSSYMN